MLYGMNSQRGVSYDPSAASKQRTEDMIRASRPAAVVEEEQAPTYASRPAAVVEEEQAPTYGRLGGTKKEQARFLDEVESAWRERERRRAGRRKRH